MNRVERRARFRYVKRPGQRRGEQVAHDAIRPLERRVVGGEVDGADDTPNRRRHTEPARPRRRNQVVHCRTEIAVGVTLTFQPEEVGLVEGDATQPALVIQALYHI